MTVQGQNSRKAIRRLLSVQDLTAQEVDYLIGMALRLMHVPDPASFALLARGKILSQLFFEPSTRTYFSFASAMQRLGGGVIGFADPSTTSSAKGETLHDTVEMMAAYSDIMVIRHPEVGAINAVTANLSIPVINGGEGDGEHPTQALYDLLTIQAELGRRDVNVVLYGDLRFGRTVHSLVLLASRFGAKFTCASPREFELPVSLQREMQAAGSPVSYADSLEEALRHADVLYMTRLQRERLTSDLAGVSDLPPLTQELLELLPDKAIIMHPLPRRNELPSDVDRNHRARYFKQARYGVALRAALLAWMLGLDEQL